MNTRTFLPLVLAATLAHADVLPPVQDSSSLKGKLSAVTGRAGTLPVNATRKGFVLFNLNSLPVDVLPGDIASPDISSCGQKISEVRGVTRYG